MLGARNLSVSLGKRAILHDVDIQLAPGEVVGLLGPNGAGKSTLMRTLSGLLPYRGVVDLDGQSLSALSDMDRARRIAFLPQARAIAWPLSVENVVRLGRTPWRGRGTSLAHDEDMVTQSMTMMDVEPLRRRPVTELSGGEQARVLAARAIAQETPLLLADEPVSGLDPAHQMGMMAAFRRLARDGGTILLSLHDLTLAARWCDRVILIKEGRIYATGAPAETLTPKALRDVFGIEAMFSADSCGLVLAPTGLSASHENGTGLK